MRLRLLKHLILLLASAVPFTSGAAVPNVGTRFALNGLYYVVESSETVAVTYGLSLTSDPQRYKGDITIPQTINYNGNTFTVTKIEMQAFSECNLITSIKIPETVHTIGRNAFQNCTSLTSINLPTNFYTIAARTFYGCSSLTSITLPENVTNIGMYAFAECSNLTEIEIPGPVTAILDDTFQECSSLKRVKLPNTIKTIGKFAFGICIYNHRTTKTNQKYPSVNL